MVGLLPLSRALGGLGFLIRIIIYIILGYFISVVESLWAHCLKLVDPVALPGQ